jgi:hypothetical protein
MLMVLKEACCNPKKEAERALRDQCLLTGRLIYHGGTPGMPYYCILNKATVAGPSAGKHKSCPFGITADLVVHENAMNGSFDEIIFSKMASCQLREDTLRAGRSTRTNALQKENQLTIILID